MRQRAPLGFGGEEDPWYRPPPGAYDPRAPLRKAGRGRRCAVPFVLAIVLLSLGSCAWLYRSFQAGHALFTAALASVRLGRILGLSERLASDRSSTALSCAHRVLSTASAPRNDADEAGAAALLERAENRSSWWFGQPSWCAIERSNRAGVVWWDVRAEGAPAVPAVIWLDGVYSPAAPARLGCHWAAALNARILVPELSADQSTSQLVMHLHRVHRRLFAEAGAGRTALLATSPDASWLAITSTLRLTKGAVELPSALILVSPLVDLDLDAHTSHRAVPLPNDAMTAARLERLVRRLVGLPAAAPTTGVAAQQPAASTLHRLSPSWQALAGLPPVMVLWGGAELLSDQIRGFVHRLREAEVAVMDAPRSELGHGWLRTAQWLTSEGSLDMLSISRFLVQNGLKA